MKSALPLSVSPNTRIQVKMENIRGEDVCLDQHML